jgi:hypothetical protein
VREVGRRAVTSCDRERATQPGSPQRPHLSCFRLADSELACCNWRSCTSATVFSDLHAWRTTDAAVHDDWADDWMAAAALESATPSVSAQPDCSRSCRAAGISAGSDATVSGWVVLAGAIVAASISTEKIGPRIVAMVACLGLCIGGPALAWLGVLTGINAQQLVDLSPLLAIRTLVEGGASPPTDIQWRWIMLLCVADVAVWIAAWNSGRLLQRTPVHR